MIDITLQHLQTFLILAELKSFTATAEQLNVSKASVSQTIKLLEDKMQLPLFIRTTRTVALSDEGKLLYEQCKRIQSEYQIAQNLIGGFKATPSGTLRISCNPYFAQTHLTNLINQYHQTFPNVKIDIITEERMPDMQKESIDLVFGVNWPCPDDVVAKKIGETRYVFCASPSYLKQHGTPTQLKELSQHQYIAHSGRADENLIVGKPANLSIPLNINLTANNALIMKKFAAMGLGIIQLHDYAVEEDIKQGKLIEILSDQVTINRPLYIYYQKHRYVQPKVRQFVNLCRQI